jgi:2,4-dienoyl-CoA reductase-like NADH-dependent reductase (Old Yellow Enzyme family)
MERPELFINFYKALSLQVHSNFTTQALHTSSNQAKMAPHRYQSTEHKDAAPLGKPLDFAFSKKTAQNRFLKGAMTERLSSWDPTNLEARGIPSKNLVNVYRRWGEGEFGVILTGNIMIEYDHLEAAGNPIIPRGSKYEGERFEGFKDLAKQAKKHGSLIVGQVSHPGRQVTEQIQKNPISASDVHLEGNVLGMTFAKPRAATTEDIENIIEGFAHAAEYLEKAGYDGIQLHGAHGYLLAQFLSPSTNKRTDKYGGSLENRARLITEIGQKIRKRTSESFVLSIKLNSVEFQENGFDTAEAATLCKLLEDNTFDFVELSGGTYEKLAFVHQRESTKKREAFFLDFAEKITPSLSKTRTYVTGGFKTASAMVDALQAVDGVGLARPICLEPELSKQIIAGKVDAAIDQLTDDDDFGITNVAAGTQIKQLGKDQQPIDLSDEKNMEAFKKDMGTWAQGLQEDKTGSRYGFVDIDSIPWVPYGTAAPSL